MKPNSAFLDLDLEFWANIKLLNQRLGYVTRMSKTQKEFKFLVPTVDQIISVFESENLNVSKLIVDNSLTEFGKHLVGYMEYRGDVLVNYVRPHLMKKEKAEELFNSLKKELNPTCPLPLNKQKNEKKDYAYLTGIVNMLIENGINPYSCNYDPKELTAITENGYPVRTLTRRVDGAFPGVINPIAIWEIKEYYYTTTFGSRVADGVYETQLDGWELWEAREKLQKQIMHYLIIDDYHTWWTQGRSYLCRIIDSMHMGLVSEVIFGSEVLERIPILVSEWKEIISLQMPKLDNGEDNLIFK